MARRSRGPVRFVRPAPRTKIWIGEGVGITTITASTKHLVSTLSVGALSLRPFTILRTRLILMYRSDQIAASEVPFGTYASLVVTDTAAALGATAVPSPSGVTGDPEAAWFTYQPVHNQLRLVSAVGFEFRTDRQYVIDDKSMRKVGADDDVAAVFTQDAAVGATLYTSGRQLIQLH